MTIEHCKIFSSQKKVLLESPSSIFYERKFDTAIRQSTVTNFFDRHQRNEPTDDDKLLSRSILFNLPDSTAPSTLAYTDILSRIFLDSKNHELYQPKTSMKVNKTLSQVLYKTLEIQVTHMMEKYELSNKENIISSLHQKNGKLDLPLLLTNLLSISKIFYDVIEQCHNIHSP